MQQFGTIFVPRTDAAPASKGAEEESKHKQTLPLGTAFVSRTGAKRLLCSRWQAKDPASTSASRDSALQRLAPLLWPAKM